MNYCCSLPVIGRKINRITMSSETVKDGQKMIVGMLGALHMEQRVSANMVILFEGMR
jgi:hypothetical protein